MSAFLLVLAKLGLSFLGFVGMALVPFGLPGNWLVALAALASPWLGYGWTPFLWILAAAILAEILEFYLSLYMAKRKGASKAGMWGAFLGSLVGAVLGTPVFPVLGTLMGAGLGAFLGAVGFEIAFARKGLEESMGAGTGAFWGVMLARAAKIALGMVQFGYWLWILWLPAT
ncbi:MAG: DUF456 domain-containing protein [Planctomycetota bacterium]|nr:MAG: DUF456 domain-containing protein [Planctomycetota bacterium]